MRTLGIHSKHFRFRSNEKATPGAESISPDNRLSEIDGECLVIFISVEESDASSPMSVALQLATDTLKRAEQLNVDTVVIYPYVHLTDNPATPTIATKVLAEVAAQLSATLDVIRVPFGWYKSFEIACLGHPLSEWSGRYSPGKEVAKESPEETKRKSSEFTRFVVVGLKGDAYEVTAEDFSDCPIFRGDQPRYELLRQFVSNELRGGVDTHAAPKHIGYMRQHELLDYCDVSEKGHHKWYPNGVLIQRLILDYASRLAREWGAFEMQNPLVIRGDHNVVGELMGEFHERDYQVDGGRGVCYLRYASDPLAFPFMQNVRFNARQSPLKVYEEATCFRNEQEGEVSGLKRVRQFTMTDMHAACSTVDEAKREFEGLCLRFAELMNDIIALDCWVLGWEGTIDFYEQNKDWLVGIGKRMGVPAFFKLMPQMSHYYAIKNEYQFITEDRANVQVSTVQWDVKDGERFNIGTIGEKGDKRPCPVIIHASSFGSIERTLCAILENIAIMARLGKAPVLPLWLAPTQVRILPVSEEHLSFASELCSRLAGDRIRADIDDRDDTVGKKVRNGEQDWIPYLLVVGDKEKATDRLTVRSREDGSQEKMTVDQFAAMVNSRTARMPHRPLQLDRLVSKRPQFFG